MDEENELKRFWAYRHIDGHIHVRRFFDLADVEDAYDSDFVDDVLDLLAHHPDVSQKVGAGVKEIYVDRTPPWNTKGFFLTRVDGTSTDFSYKACLSGDGTPRQRFSMAARSAIQPTIAKYRNEVFSSHSVFCPMTGKQLMPDTCHIDHAPPNIFSKIVNDYLSENKIDLLSIRYRFRKDMITTERFLDEELIASFVEFHNQRATLRAVDKDWNIKVGNRSNV